MMVVDKEWGWANGKLVTDVCAELFYQAHVVWGQLRHSGLYAGAG